MGQRELLAGAKEQKTMWLVWNPEGRSRQMKEEGMTEGGADKSCGPGSPQQGVLTLLCGDRETVTSQEHTRSPSILESRLRRASGGGIRRETRGRGDWDDDCGKGNKGPGAWVSKRWCVEQGRDQHLPKR